MADEPIETTNNEPQKEETPAWATKLQKTLENLPDRLSELLTPKEPEEPSNEIPVPQPPEPPTPEEVPTEEPPEQPPEEKPKKRNLLNWLL